MHSSTYQTNLQAFSRCRLSTNCSGLSTLFRKGNIY